MADSLVINSKIFTNFLFRIVDMCVYNIDMTGTAQLIGQKQSNDTACDVLLC